MKNQSLLIVLNLIATIVFVAISITWFVYGKPITGIITGSAAILFTFSTLIQIRNSKL